MRKSFSASLKAEHRSELHNRLIDSGFTDYDLHLEWLRSVTDSPPSKNSLIIYGGKLKDQLEHLRLQEDYRRAYQQELNDDIQVNSVNLIATAQRATQFLLDRVETRMKNLDDECGDSQLAIAANTLSKVVSSIGTLNSSQVVNQKYLDEKRAKQEAKFNELAAEGQSRGIDEEFMRRMRVEVLGMGD